MGLDFESRYLITDQKTIKVVGEISLEKTMNEYMNGKGYVKFDNPNVDDDNGSIWIYSAEGAPLYKDKFPFFWFDENKIVFSNPEDSVRKLFTLSNTKPFDVNTIIQNTKANDVLFDKDEIADINASTSIFIPDIKPTDDYLKKLIKAVIISKKIDINRLKSKTDEKYQLPNMKAALISDTCMSVKNFIRWTDLLCCKFEMTVYDDPDIKHDDTLANPVLYNSSENKLYSCKGNNMQEISNHTLTNELSEKSGTDEVQNDETD